VWVDTPTQDNFWADFDDVVNTSSEMLVPTRHGQNVIVEELDVEEGVITKDPEGVENVIVEKKVVTQEPIVAQEPVVKEWDFSGGQFKADQDAGPDLYEMLRKPLMILDPNTNEMHPYNAPRHEKNHCGARKSTASMGPSRQEILEHALQLSQGVTMLLNLLKGEE
jgi:hypothetical protein